MKKKAKEQIMEKLKSKETYMISFYEEKGIETGKQAPYAYYILNDGTFVFPFDGISSPQDLRVSTEKHKDLLEEIIQLSEVDF